MKRNKILMTVNVDEYSFDYLKEYSKNREMSLSSLIDELVIKETYRIEKEVIALKKMIKK